MDVLSVIRQIIEETTEAAQDRGIRTACLGIHIYSVATNMSVTDRIFYFIQPDAGLSRREINQLIDDIDGMLSKMARTGQPSHVGDITWDYERKLKGGILVNYEGRLYIVACMDIDRQEEEMYILTQAAISEIGKE